MSGEITMGLGRFDFTGHGGEAAQCVVYPPDILSIRGYAGTLVTIKNDGSIVYGPNYTPDAAGKLFWEAVAHFAPRPFA